jgi:nucleotide-binding universal stress UspA family protein
MDAIRSILLTTDFSDTSARAFASAKSLAGKFGARIIVAHVEDDRVSPLLVEYMPLGLVTVRRRQVEDAKRQLAEVVAQHLGRIDDVELEVSLGVPHGEIVRLAAERDVDLIVMATHGRGFISHAIMGSTTERVLRRSPCPVLVVPGEQG